MYYDVSQIRQISSTLQQCCSKMLHLPGKSAQPCASAGFVPRAAVSFLTPSRSPLMIDNQNDFQVKQEWERSLKGFGMLPQSFTVPINN